MTSSGVDGVPVDLEREGDGVVVAGGCVADEEGDVGDARRVEQVDIQLTGRE